MSGIILPAWFEFLYTPTDSMEGKKKILLEMLSFSKALLKAALIDLKSQSFSPDSTNYVNTLERECFWRENIYLPFFVKDSSTHHVPQWLKNPTTEDDFQKIMLSIVNAWRELLKDINATDSPLLKQAKTNEVKENIKKAIECEIRKACVEIVSEAIVGLTKTSTWNGKIEKKLLESFNNPDKFSKVMGQIIENFEDFLPQELLTLFDWEDWKNWVQNPHYFEANLFAPLFVQSDFVSSKRIGELNFRKFPKNVRDALETFFLLEENVSTDVKMDSILLLIKMGLSIEGVRHLIYPLSPNNMRHVLQNEEFWVVLKKGHAKAVNSSLSVVCDRQVLELFLHIMNVHASLATSKRNTKNKVEDFIRLLHQMWEQDYLSPKAHGRLTRELSTESRHHGVSFMGNFIHSYQYQYDKLANYFEKNADYYLNESTCPTDLRWYHDKESVRNKKSFEKMKIMSEAMTYYIDYLNFLKMQKETPGFRPLTPGEKLLIKALDESIYFKLSHTSFSLRKKPMKYPVEPDPVIAANGLPVAKANIIPVVDTENVFILSNQSSFFASEKNNGAVKPSAPPIESHAIPTKVIISKAM